MKYFLIAGEASGDLHASNLMKELVRIDPDAEFRYMGGDLMEQVSPGMLMHYRETSYMMLDVLFHLGKIFRNLRLIKEELLEWKPDLLIPVDYPGFNLRIAKFAFKKGIKVFYYISPKVWAWKKRRVRDLRRYVQKLFVILPFEVDFFRKLGMDVEYFGNPLVDGVKDFLNDFEGRDQWKKNHGLDERPVVALLAGSRKKEIQGMLPPMKQVASGHPGFQFVVAGAPSIEAEFYDAFLQGGQLKIVYGETYGLLASSTAALVTSGTATLETALIGIPQVVLYRTSSLAYAIAKQLVRIKYISLVNLILDRGLVLEVLQKRLFVQTESELSRILDDPSHRKKIVKGYEELNSLVGETGVSKRIAYRMVELLNVPEE